MELINNQLLWGLLALSIPLALHFWNQKKAQPLPWAATKWLTEKTKTSAKGIKLDEILLLIIRLLIFTLICIFLASILLKSKNGVDSKIHILESNQSVLESFRFEISEALKKGEKVVLVDGTEIENMDFKIVEKPLDIKEFQKTLNAQDKPNFEVYLNHSNILNTAPEIFIPGKSKIHLVDIQNITNTTCIKISENEYLISEKGKLKISKTPIGRIAVSNPIKTKIDTSISDKNVLKAGLRALEKTYGLRFDYAATETPDLYFSKDLKNENTILIGDFESYTKPSLAIPETLNIAENLEIYEGKLPEILGKMLFEKWGVISSSNVKTKGQVLALFKTKENTNEKRNPLLNDIIAIVLLLLIGLERYLSLRNAKH